MNENFFANYKEYIIPPIEEKKVSEKLFNPKDYQSHYILTLSLYDGLVLNWFEAAEKYELNIDQNIQDVLIEFNNMQEGVYYLQLLELEGEQPYFVLSLSCKSKIEEKELEERISYIIEKISNPFYVGQSWYCLIGEKGRIKRKLFRYSYREYRV